MGIQAPQYFPAEEHAQLRHSHRRMVWPRDLSDSLLWRLSLRRDPFVAWQTAENVAPVQVMAKIGSFPLIIRPAFTLGGTGGGIAYNMEEFEEIIATGLDASMTSQVRTCPLCSTACTAVVGAAGSQVCKPHEWSPFHSAP